MTATARRGRRPTGRVTVRDVAEAAGVSTATVTRALQGHPAVRETTRSQVEAAARRLGYRPDRIARTLVTQTSTTVGMLIPWSDDLFWGEVAAGIEEAASEARYSVLFANSRLDPERERHMIEVFLAHRVAGIVIAGAAGNVETWFSDRGPEVPTVIVNWDTALPANLLERARAGPPGDVLQAVASATQTGPEVAQVVFDDLAAAREAVRHLVGLGHERLAFVGGDPIRPCLLRMAGFRMQLAEAGLPAGDIVPAPRSPEGGFRAAQDLFAAGFGEHPTAIVAYDDAVAMGVIRAAHALGVQVPEDLSVLGFDDVEMAAFSEPPLTTVRQPRREMGRLAMSSILGWIRGEQPAHLAVLQGALVVRGSTAAPPT